MTERLLQYIWQFQYFSKTELTTTEGEPVDVVYPGLFNTNQGPDFSAARIRIGNTLWAGAVELHINCSDWNKHQHQHDKNYSNVILHVVWNDDDRLKTSLLPVVELKSRVSKLLLQRYESLMNSSAFIPCEKTIHSVSDIVWKGWKERLVAERLMRKSEMVMNFLKENNQHWEETCWWLLARNFGIKVNADVFETMARSISVKILSKIGYHLQKLEALLMGQAGLLDRDFRDEYPKELLKEYRLQKKNYQLHQTRKVADFLRMRPESFPTIRLAQLAVLLHKSAHLFSKIKEENSATAVKNLFNITLDGYWDTHYCFDEISPVRKKRLGKSMADNILINSVVPLLFAYGHYHNDWRYKDKSLRWLEETSAESNSIIAGFKKTLIQAHTAHDTQALLELRNEYCLKKRCLDCAVGNAIIGKKN